MAEPTRQVACDDAGVERALLALLARFREAGGWLAEAARIRCRDGALSVELRRAGDGDLILLPRCGLLPVNEAALRLEGEALVAGRVPAEWTEHTRALFDAMLEVYNLTGKAATEREVGTLHALARDAGLAEWFRPLLEESRPELARGLERARRGDPGLVVETFLHSRVLGFDDPASPVYGREQVVMTVIDFLNHHHGAAGFETRHDERRGVHLAVRGWRAGSGECFVHYGNYDALDMLLNYGFVDTSAPFVRSLPVRLDPPGLEPLEVRSTPFVHRGELPPALRGLRPHLPAIRRDGEGRPILSHLLIPTGANSGALRAVLRHVIRQIAPRLPPLRAMQAIRACEGQLLEHNRRRYRELGDWVAANRPGSRWPDLPARAAELARVQLAKLEEYRPPG